MSYDVRLVIDTGGEEPHEIAWWNITYNLRAMFAEGGLRLREWHGLPATVVEPAVRDAIRQMREDPARFRRHNPSNGWGDYDSCLHWLEVVADGMAEHPRTTVTVT